MKPYYEEDGITIYHGDCLAIMADLAFDVVVTDPPYGIAWKRGDNRKGNYSKAHTGILNDHDTTYRDSMLNLAQDRPCVVFGSFYAPFPTGVKQVLVWHKPPDSGLVGSTTGYRRDAEPIFLTGTWPTRPVQYSSVLHVRTGQGTATSRTGHPHTKPVALMTWLIQAAPPGTILDPFAGSGSTLLAAKQLGRTAIGIELDERYCETAARRLSQGVLAL